MPFFQNVFTSDFVMPLALGDRHYAPSFKLHTNSGRGNELVTAWKDAPYNLSGNDSDGNSSALLQIAFAIDTSFKNWSYFSVDITSGAGSASAVTADEIVAALNANSGFNGWFTAWAITTNANSPINSPKRVQFKQKKPIDRMKFYVVNGGAEEKLGFNARAGVAELPSLFSKHTIANRFAYPDSIGLLIQLDPFNKNVDSNLIANAIDENGNSLSYDASVVHEDWQLLKGSSGIFDFQNNTVDGSGRITQTISYPCGATVGDFAKKTNYTYTSANTNPTTKTEVPYILTASDLLTLPRTYTFSSGGIGAKMAGSAVVTKTP